MLSNRKFGSSAVEPSLICEGEFGGDVYVNAYYCRKDGFIDSTNRKEKTSNGECHRALCCEGEDNCPSKRLSDN